MLKRYLITFIVILTTFQFAMSQSTEARIHHSVFFKLKWAAGSNEEKQFFAAAKKLASIPGVEKFQFLKEISKGNKFQLGLSMEFENSKLYEAYLIHPDHTAFVQDRWLKEVEDYMEIDYQVIPQ